MRGLSVCFVASLNCSWSLRLLPPYQHGVPLGQGDQLLSQKLHGTLWQLRIGPLSNLFGQLDKDRLAGEQGTRSVTAFCRGIPTMAGLGGAGLVLFRCYEKYAVHR